MTVSICPGSFDPITLGHLDIIERSTYIYDEVIVAVAKEPNKKTLFSAEERLELTKEAVESLGNVQVFLFDCLLVDFARLKNANVIVKGLRAISDFEHEFQMALLNKTLDNSIETVFMMASPEYMFLSSSAVKEIAAYGGNIGKLVPPGIAKRLTKTEEVKGTFFPSAAKSSSLSISPIRSI